VVEGHGDLRPQHICVEDPPVIFDCLEFNRRLRIIDAADELAFLALECERLGAPWVRRLLFEIYTRATGDYPPHRLLRFYTSYRAAMWARLAIWRTHDLPPDQWRKWLDRAATYLRLAETYTPYG
jgi:aminoglycoside phosphotransferase family enzyme